ncbi:MAG: flippase [Methanobrevibacter sp.]|jgi:stage V sporulation protein B|nr:flippase [Methanobrevibacter sp.]
MSSKIAKGGLIIVVGNAIFRVGGYIYRFIMAGLLGPASYGILTTTLQFQGIFQVLAAGGIPPAIAKYIAEYTALDENALARQTVYTSLKIMGILGILSGIIIVFVVAPWLALDFFNKPEALLPLQAVGLITPFSAIVGGFRGSFQGAYKMEYILYTRGVEQSCMILFATALVILGFSVFGAVIGSAGAFVASTIVSIFVFQKYMVKIIPQPVEGLKFSLKEELNLAKKIITFSIPVIITALAEMGIFAISTFILAKFLDSRFVGYFGASDPISRLPLIISSSIATVILPAVAASFAKKNQKQLEKYVSQSYRYSLFIIIPMCIGLALFAKPIMELVYFTNLEYTAGAGALAILSIGMGFYSLFAVSTGIVQGIGNPRIPMYCLAGGAFLTFILNWIMVPIYGIVGASTATTIACFCLMLPMVYLSFKQTKSKFPMQFIVKTLISALLMGVIIIILPKTVLGLITGIIICPIAYLIFLVLTKTFSLDDLDAIIFYTKKFGPINKLVKKIVNLIKKVYDKY